MGRVVVVVVVVGGGGGGGGGVGTLVITRNENPVRGHKIGSNTSEVKGGYSGLGGTPREEKSARTLQPITWCIGGDHHARQAAHLV